MSIASKEAYIEYPTLPISTDVESHDFMLRHLEAQAEELRRVDLRAAYVSGRTAESTEAEVRTAAIQQYFIEMPLHNAAATLEQAESDFDVAMPGSERRMRMTNARSVLASVRSAVMA